jgi:type IV pilus assembly protein PilV
MRYARSPRTLGSSRGLTLVEVLVTLVIISVGLLGVAALQLTTVRNNYDSFVRSQAAMLASDMLDRMRANRNRAKEYVVEMDKTVGDTPEGADTTRWRATLDAQLPNGKGAIAFDEATEIVTIAIQWSERADLPENRTLVFRTSSQI